MTELWNGPDPCYTLQVQLLWYVAFSICYTCMLDHLSQRWALLLVLVVHAGNILHFIPSSERTKSPSKVHVDRISSHEVVHLVADGDDRTAVEIWNNVLSNSALAC